MHVAQHGSVRESQHAIHRLAGIHGFKVAMDGRSMVSTLEMAVRHGFMRIPKGTFIPIASVATMKDQRVVVVCTGSR